MTPSVQMRIDTAGRDGIPHSFISVTHSYGTITEYGLVPAEHLSMAGQEKSTLLALILHTNDHMRLILQVNLSS